MTGLSGLWRNASVSSISTAGQGLLNLATVIYLARIFGPQVYGVFSYTWAVVGIVGLLGYLGIPVLIARNLSRSNDPNTVVSFGVSLTSLLGLLVSLGFLAAVQVVPELHHYGRLFDLWAVFMLGNTISPRMLFGAIQRLWVPSVGDFVGALLRLFATLGYVHNPHELGRAITITVLSFLFPILAELMWLRHIIPFRIHWVRWRDAYQTIRQAMPLGVTGLIGVLYSGLDTWILQAFVGSQAVGYYAAAYRPIVFLSTFSAVFFNLIFPILSRLTLRDRPTTERVIQLATLAIFAVVLPVGIGTIDIARPLVLTVFGSRYAPSGPVMAIVIWSWSLGLLRDIFSTTLIAANQEKLFARLFAFSGVANVILMLVLVHWGPRGTASALVITQALLLVLCYNAVRRTLVFTPVNWKAQYGSYIKILVNSLVMGIIVWFVRSYVPAEVAIGIGVIVYAGLTLLTRSLPWHDILTTMRMAP